MPKFRRYFNLHKEQSALKGLLERIHMTINTNPAGLQQANNFADAKKPGDKALQNIAALRAIAATDGANLAIADGLRTQANTIEQGIANAYDAIGILQIADASLSSITDSAVRLGELSVQSNNAILSERQRQMINTEAQRLTGSINDAFNNANYAGKNVFQSLDFVVGTGSVDSENLNPISSAGLSIDNYDSITTFIDQVGSLRADIGAGINALASNINAAAQNELSVRKAESEMLNDEVGANTIDINTSFLKQNATAFAMAHRTELLKQNVGALLQG